MKIGRSTGKVLRYFLLGSIALLLVVFAVGYIYLAGEGAKPERSGSERVTIPPGRTAGEVAEILHHRGLVSDPQRFLSYLKVRRLTGKLRAGVYEIERSWPTRRIAEQLVAGREAMTVITIPEGWTACRIGGILEQAGVCDSAEFLAVVHDSALVRRLGLPGASLEGYLFPETYSFRHHTPPREAAELMVETFREKVGADWLKRAERDTLGLHGIVTLASIVQGEFQIREEAPDVAAVYRNRLRKGWKLQADPTIQYILPGPPRRLLLKDLEIDSPYNTYRYRGLPPGPIGNPGLAALEAALEPADKPWLFMVATGDGGHTFTTNFAEHNREKARFDRVRREVVRKQRQEGR